MQAVVWFLVGAIASLMGAAAGTPLNGWMAWMAAVACGVVATALSKRLSVLAGSSVVCAIAGARVVGDVRLAVVAALATLATLLLGSYGVIGLCRALVAAPQLHRSPRRAARGAAAEVGDAPEAPLTDERVASLVRLAAADTDAFRAAAVTLSPAQRRQVREALLAAR